MGKKSVRSDITWADSVDLAAHSAAGRASFASRPRRPKRGNPGQNEREYSDDEREYLRAVGEYQKRYGVCFPTACEYRDVLISLGYRKVDG